MKKSQDGLTVMIDNLFGDKAGTINALQSAVNHTISDIKLEDNMNIKITLDTGDILVITDEGQSCCEQRYITCDADLPTYVGKKILNFRQDEYRASDEEQENSEWGDAHEIQNLIIVTDEGNIDFVTHVVHNGYYGGFVIRARLLKG